MGAMRLPVIGGDGAKIDEAAVAEMVAYAMEQGVNYYDTAWGYHDGNSELVMGKAVSGYPREKFFLATKFWVMTYPICRRSKKSLSASLRNAVLIILIFICSTMSVK